MLRDFNTILCLLLSINSIICYNYISDGNFLQKQARRLNERYRGANKKARVNKSHDQSIRKDYELDEKDPVAQIDVASFIQKPDEYPVEDAIHYSDAMKSTIKQNNYNDYASLLGYDLNENIIKSNERPYYTNHADNSADSHKTFKYNDAINSGHLYENSLPIRGLNNEKIHRRVSKPSADDYRRENGVDEIPVHNPEKKCVMKYLKFPFFSHNKTDARKPAKKDKRRKIFCFNCPNKDKEKSNDMSDIHIKQDIKMEDLKLNNKFTTVAGDIEGLQTTNGKRQKRNEDWSSARERQLKELQEIQRKVDSVEILSTFDKSPELSN